MSITGLSGLQAAIDGRKLPTHVKEVRADGIQQVKLIAATSIGINVRSTVTTYINVHDELFGSLLIEKTAIFCYNLVAGNGCEKY